jgi:hypothetical protein
MNSIIVKPEPGEYSERYIHYVGLVPSEDLIKELQYQLQTFTAFINNIPDEKMSYRYAEGKWTVAQIFQHVVDTERIYVFRMLNFVRQGWMDIPGFDQDAFAKNADVSKRAKQSFIDEFDAVRKSSIEFLKSITPEQSLIIGKANDVKVSVRAMGYVAYGHIAHHSAVIREKYLNS